MNFDIETIKKKLLVKYPFFGSVVANVKYKENKNVATAATDGQIIYYNLEFAEKLNIDEQIFLIAHEVCHIAFDHVLKIEGKDPELWNIATDAVINAFLKKDGLTIIKGGVDIAEAIKYDAEQLYEKLLKEKKEKQKQESQKQQQKSQGDKQQNKLKGSQTQQSKSQQEKNSKQQTKDNSEKQNEQNKSEPGKNEQSYSGKSQENQSQDSSQQNNNSFFGTPSGDQEQKENKDNERDGESSSQIKNEQKDSQLDGNSSQQGENQKEKQDVGHDSHSLWEDAVKKHKEKQSKEEKDNLSKEESHTDKTQNKTDKTAVEKKQEECKKIGEKESFKKNREEKKKMLEKLKEQIMKQAFQAGSNTSENIRKVTDIGTDKPLIDWRYVLREAIKYDVDWSYRNATIENGVVVPRLEKLPTPEAEIVLDTSGSIDEILLRNFLRECKNILKYSRLKVGCFDTKFYGFHEIRTEKDIENMEFVGGGGTDFDVAVGAFTRRVENKIIFTDGIASMPQKPMNVIWIVFGGKKITPKGGKVIQIDEKQLKKLYNYETCNDKDKKSR